MKITVLGDGAWGTAFALFLADNGHDVTLWCYDTQVFDDIKNKDQNCKFLPSIKLNKKIKVTLDLANAIDQADLICEAIPVKYLRQILNNIKNSASKQNLNQIPWLILSKGIENNTLLFPSQIVNEIIGAQNIAVLSGPSFAQDLANKQITAANLACSNLELAKNLKIILDNNYFYTKITNDVIGVQVAGAMKNVIAILIGILDGAGYTENTKALILTQGINQICQMIKALLGNPETVYDLAGIGDLVLTSYSNKSKNFKIGQLIGQAIKENKNFDDILKPELLPEGFNTLNSVLELAQNYNIDLKLISNLHQVLYHQKNLKIIFDDIIS